MNTTITMLYRSLLCASACLAAVSPAVAEPPAKRDPAAMLKRSDTDGDGKVSRDEFIKAGTARLEAMFARMDADGDGTLTREEFAAGGERMRDGALRNGKAAGDRGLPGRGDRGPEQGFRKPPQQD